MSSANAEQWRKLHGNSFEGRRVLITGGAGFIGSHLAEALVALGASVVVIDDLSGGSRDNIAGFSSLTFHQGSILDQDLLKRATEGCAYVFHQAALGSVPRSVEQPRLYNEVNTTGTLNVLDAARAAGVKRVMFAASSSAYGLNPVPWVETMPVLPRSPYAATKVAGEGLLRAYAASYGMDTAALRYFNIFGPRQNANSAYAAVIAAFAKAYLGGRRPTIYGAREPAGGAAHQPDRRRGDQRGHGGADLRQSTGGGHGGALRPAGIDAGVRARAGGRHPALVRRPAAGAADPGIRTGRVVRGGAARDAGVVSVGPGLARGRRVRRSRGGIHRPGERVIRGVRRSSRGIARGYSVLCQ
jgi:NAD(P)-dependent dehydrogenase (short-subunit alcohol dehydrogenase family)